MICQLVSYRTPDKKHNQHSMVIPIFLSDFTEWVRESGGKVLSVHVDPIQELSDMAQYTTPDNWPSSAEHKGMMILLDLLRTDR